MRPVGPRDMPASRTGLRSVGRVNRYQRHPCHGGLVLNKATELAERPRVQDAPLGPGSPYPISKSLQVLKGDSAFGAFGLAHHTFTDLVIHVAHESCLASSHAPEAPPCRRRVLTLQTAPLTLAPLSQRADVCVALNRVGAGFLGKDAAVARHGQLLDAQVDANESGGPNDFGVRKRNTALKQPFAGTMNQVTLADSASLQSRKISVPADVRDPLASVNRPDRYLPPRSKEREHPGVVRHGTERTKDVWPRSAGAAIGIRVADAGNRPHSGLRPKAGRPNFSIGELVQGEAPKHAVLPCQPRGVIGGAVTAFGGLLQQARLVGGRKNPDLDHSHRHGSSLRPPRTTADTLAERSDTLRSQR